MLQSCLTFSVASSGHSRSFQIQSSKVLFASSPFRHSVGSLFIIDVAVLSSDYVVLISSIVEVLRRGVWMIFRIENETINNYEGYRPSGTVVPKLFQ